MTPQWKARALAAEEELARLDDREWRRPSARAMWKRWGDCNEPGVAWRRSAEHGWLPVCVDHRADNPECPGDATELPPAERSVGEVVDRQWLLHNEDRVPEYPTGPACTHDSEGGY